MDDRHELLYIGGGWRKPVTAGRIEVTSASTEESLGGVPEAAEGDIDLAVAGARYVFADPAGRASWDAARGRRWSGSRQQRRSLRP
jgi:aldehyde dehydrogenase (NAD+)